jgi:5-methylcytosine-specific restriction protein A
MPTRAKIYRAKPAPKAAPQPRPSPTARGYNRRWNRARLAFLNEYPLCASCVRKGRTTEATVVDHKEPHKGDPTLFWDRGNWQPLCVRCHNAKSATEKGGGGG